jgi:hypothetical protein
VVYGELRLKSLPYTSLELSMRLTIIVTVMLAVFPNLSSGQVTERPRLAETAQQATRSFKDVTASTVARLPDVSVLLSAGKEEKAVEANLGLALGNFSLDGKLKGPLDEGEPDTNLATLGGLTNGTTFDVGVSYLHWEPNADVKQQNAICVEFLRSQQKDLADARKIGQAGTTGGCTWSQLPRESFRQQYVNASSQSRREEVCRQFALSTLQDPDKFECAVVNLPETSLSARYDRLTEWSMPFQIGVRYERGRKKFAWADADTGQAMSAVEDPWEIGVGANLLVSSAAIGDLALGIEYRRQSAFEEENKRDVCHPLETSPAVTTCRSLAFGRYTEARRNIITGIVRKWIGSAAADFRYSWETTTERHSVEVPLYFLGAAGKGLTGGIAPGWATKDAKGDGGWTVRAFVGGVISIWPRPR